MKKIILTLIFLSIATTLFSQTEVKKKSKKKKVEIQKAAITEKPCDSKEDFLKKLEEKKKEESNAAPKAFSLQGGDTGCKVK